MKPTLSVLLVCLISVGCSSRAHLFPNQVNPAKVAAVAPSASGANEVGNGGDYTRLLFEQGRIQAAAIVERVRSRFFPIDLMDYLKPGEDDWLRKNKTQIRDDILRTKHIWVDKLPNECPTKEWACAPRPGVAYFSTPLCEAKISKPRQAAFLLIHETMHHFWGADEEKAKRLSVFYQVVWMNMGHPESPHWKIIGIPGSKIYTVINDGTHTYSAWNGKKLAVWGSGKMHYYDPTTDEWATEEMDSEVGNPAYEDASPWARLLPFAIGEQLLMLRPWGNWNKRYNQEKKEWGPEPAVQLYGST